jgi:hypothetical protein
MLSGQPYSSASTLSGIFWLNHKLFLHVICIWVGGYAKALSHANCVGSPERNDEISSNTASNIVVRLPLEIADLFEEWLEANYPDRKAKVMSLIRQMRDGERYQSEFDTRMRGTGPIANGQMQLL